MVTQKVQRWRSLKEDSLWLSKVHFGVASTVQWEATFSVDPQSKAVKSKASRAMQTYTWTLVLLLTISDAPLACLMFLHVSFLPYVMGIGSISSSLSNCMTQLHNLYHVPSRIWQIVSSWQGLDSLSSSCLVSRPRKIRFLSDSWYTSPFVAAQGTLFQTEEKAPFGKVSGEFISLFSFPNQDIVSSPQMSLEISQVLTIPRAWSTHLPVLTRRHGAWGKSGQQNPVGFVSQSRTGRQTAESGPARLKVWWSWCSWEKNIDGTEGDNTNVFVKLYLETMIFP